MAVFKISEIIKIDSVPALPTFQQTCRNELQNAMKVSGIIDKARPYSLRHSFAGAISFRIDPKKLVRLIGHGSKQIDIRGDYIERLKEDFWLILEYMGRDFVQPKAKAPNLCMDQQYGISLAIPHYPQQVNFP